MRREVLVLLAVAITALGGHSARASSFAPTYLSSEPGSDEELHQTPPKVSVSFSEPLDRSSQLQVVDECGAPVSSGNTAVFGNEMSTDIVRTPSGRYTVVYEATGVGGVSGTTNGSLGFVVHAGTPCDGSAGGHHGGGHNGAGGGNGDGGGHGGHQGGGDHSGHAFFGDEGTAHSSHDGAMSDHAGRHEARTHDPHEGNGKKHDARAEPSKDSPGTSNASAGDTQGGGLLPAGRDAAMLGLALTIALGLAGGWLLRESAVG